MKIELKNNANILMNFSTITFPTDHFLSLFFHLSSLHNFFQTSQNCKKYLNQEWEDNEIQIQTNKQKNNNNNNSKIKNENEVKRIK